MKLYHFVITAIFSAAFVLSACNSKNEKPVVAEEVTTSPEAIPSPEGSQVPRPDQISASRSAANAEPHYKCPKNCEGGNGSGPGKCAVCGSDLVHNAAFHQNDGGQTGEKTQDLSGTQGSNVTSTQQAAQPTSPQNAHGDWHFICSKGCEGGSGAGGNCAKCGAPLNHNPIYHQ